MPTLTTPHLLPTIAPSDAPCDASLTLCALRDRVNVLLDGYDTTITTAVAAVPAAAIARPFGQLYPIVPPPAGTQVVPFLTVTIDTDGMVDLNRDPRVIRVNRDGRYWINGYMRIGLKPDGTTLDKVFATLLGGQFLGTEPSSTTEVRISGVGTFVTIADMRDATAGTEFALQITPVTTAGSGTFPIEEAVLTAFWVGDQS